jgi:N-methylhydantoinase A
MSTDRTAARLAVDIGGTFTDVALEHAGGRTTIKVLTTPVAPEVGRADGVRSILNSSGVAAADIDLIIHGTTLATNAHDRAQRARAPRC